MRTAAEATAVALAMLAVYAMTLSAYPSWDALRWAAAVAADRPELLTSVHHPLGGLLAYGIYAGVRRAGWPGDALRGLQVTSALFGALAVAGLYHLLRRVGARAGLAVSVAVGLGVSLAYWDIATDGEVYAVAAAALITAWWALLARSHGDVAGVVGAGIAAGLAVLGHQLNAVLALWAPLCFRHTGRPLRLSLLYLASAGSIVGLGYAVAWQWSTWGTSWTGAYLWLTHYLRVGLHFPAAAPVRGALAGLVHSLVPAASGAGVGSSAVAVANAVTLAALAFVGAVSVRAAWRRRDGRVVPAGLAALTAGALAAWWEPVTRKFWVPALVCGWLTVGLALAPVRGVRATGIAASVAALALLNLGVVMLPRAEPGANPFPAAARRIGAATAREDLIVLGTDILGPHVAYYADRPHVTNLFAILLGARVEGIDPRVRLGALIDEAHRRGGRVFVSSDALDLAPERRALVGPIPPTLDALLPPTRLDAALAYSIAGTSRTLFEVVGATSDE